MTQGFKDRIVRFISRRDYFPVRLSGLSKSLGILQEEHSEFKAAFNALRREGRVLVGAKGLVFGPAMSGMVTGRFEANQRGFGFVIGTEDDGQSDLFITPGDTGGAMTGDMVSAKVVKKGHRAGQMRYSGKVVEVLKRGNSRLVGTLKKYDSGLVVEVDGRGFFEPISVGNEGVKGAKLNDKVVVDIIAYPTDNHLARGAIVNVLGRAGRYDTEIQAIITQYQLPEEFDESCLAQAKEIAAGFKASTAGNRDDITGEVVITIDPDDSKDFDDAISLKRDSDNNWALGVHIADVSEFVTMDSPLDAEAKERGNSVYLPGKVIPMLPEILSNGICSLQPEQKRFVKSVYITYDEDGNVLGRSFANSVICSTARLTYMEADKILHGKAAGFSGEVVGLLKDMETLAKMIEKRRRANGMLHLDLPEIELVFDKAGRVVDAEPADDSYPHTIIEMFMVEANEAVGALLDRFDVPFMRRTHPEPDEMSLKNLGKFVKLCGMKLPRRLDRAAIQDLLAAVKGTSYSYAINMHILRSLERAEYSPKHIGHFALASKQYCHFTSPIRRYADLLIHRLLGCYLEHRLNKIGLEEVLPDGELTEIGNHITFTEQQGDWAEKELNTVLILQMLSSRVGDELNCVVSGLTNFGVFVQCTKFGIEGLVELGDLGMDEWKFSNHAQAIVGLHSGKSVHLGQEMKVKITSVNVAGRQLFVAPVDLLVISREKLPKAYSGRRGRGRKKPVRSRRR